MKVLHLDTQSIKGQLESKSLETLKLKCYDMEISKSAEIMPFGHLPQLEVVEIGAHLYEPAVRALLNLRLHLQGTYIDGQRHGPNA